MARVEGASTLSSLCLPYESRQEIYRHPLQGTRPRLGLFLHSSVCVVVVWIEIAMITNRRLSQHVADGQKRRDIGMEEEPGV